MRARIAVQSDIVRSPRVKQVEGIFDVPPAKRSQVAWDVSLPLEEKPWQVGLICGPSGCGKSTIARQLWPEQLVHAYDWPADRSILDGFAAGLPIKSIVTSLSSVGFSSPASWLRPYHVLSNGEQFRVTMARCLAEPAPIAVVDEFTSVVDRTVAKIGSAAIAKAVRRSDKQFVAVTCHMDVEDWLQPDWVYYPAERRFAWRELRQRPPIEITVNRTTHKTWQQFKHHHYLTGDLHKAAWCFVAFYEGIPIGFDSWLPFVGRLKDSRLARRGHRTVVLPDYQGVGIGRHLVDYCAGTWASLGYRVFSGVGHPAEIASRQRDGNWRCTRAPAMSAPDTSKTGLAKRMNESRALHRLRASFEWVGPTIEAADARARLELRHL